MRPAAQRDTVWCVAATLLLAGCATAPRAASEPLPSRFSLGRAAAESEIAAWDIDVMPDGTGLPAGSGSVERGQRVWIESCASCHGVDAEGAGPYQALVRPEGDPLAFVDGSDPDAFAARYVGNYWPYAPTLFDYVRRAMPFDRPGSLSDDDVYAVVAWLLWRNTLIDEDAVMDATTLPQVVMPARDRFVR